MKQFILAGCLLALAFGLQPASAQEVMPLSQLKPRSGQFTLVTDAMLGGAKQEKTYTLGQQRFVTTEFTLNRQFDWFICTVGMDDCGDTGMSTEVKILLDGKDALRYEEVTVFEPGKAVKISVRDAVRMALYVDDNYNNNGRILFINPILVKGTPPATPPSVAQSGTTIPPTAQAAAFVVDPNDLDKLAANLRKRVDAKPDIQQKLMRGFLAVMTFDLVDIPSASVGKNVAEDLSTSLINNDFQLVERGQLDKALKELKIQDSALIDQATALKLGQITGCNYIIVGSVSDRGQFLVINARFLETATGKAVAAERVECRKIEIKR